MAYIKRVDERKVILEELKKQILENGSYDLADIQNAVNVNINTVRKIVNDYLSKGKEERLKDYLYFSEDVLKTIITNIQKNDNNSSKYVSLYLEFLKYFEKRDNSVDEDLFSDKNKIMIEYIGKK